MKRNILFVIDGLEFGGGERVFAQLINGLPTDRYALSLASGSQESFHHAITNTQVQRYPVDFSNRYNLSIILDLVKIIRNARVDIVHGQGGRAEFYARLAAGLTKTARYVSTIAMPVEGYDVGGLQKKIYRFLDQFSERYVDRFIVVSDALKAVMVDQHEIPADRVVRIYNGIETDIYNSAAQADQRSAIRRELALDDDEILVGAIGRMVWQKGFDTLLRCIPEVLVQLPGAKFVLIGEGPLRKSLEDLSRSLGIGRSVIFAGHRRDIHSILAALDITVVPSVLEGFPMITLEAMSMGKPIVATRIDGTVEQITDGEEGLLVPPGCFAELSRAIVRIADDPVLAAKLGDAARRKAIAEFSVQKMIQETMNVYDELF
jgi:glycosyltransferase involved in cell wall biosynthesis